MAYKDSVRRRPPRHPAESFRVKAWFNAVALRSGKTAYALELEFARPESILRFEEGTVQRPSLWDKYARGEVTPGRDRLTLDDQKPNLVDRVEDRYPGSAYWLRHPFWAALQLAMVPMKHSAPLETVNGWMEKLHGEAAAAAALFADAPPQAGTPFRRRAVDFHCLDRLSDLGTFDGAAALMLLLREAMLFQDAERYERLLQEMHHYDSWFATWPETAPFHRELLNYLDARFGRMLLPDGRVGWKYLRRDWTLHQENWWKMRPLPPE
ncbi:hypothetical protein [Aromatoleum evansii]|uniref:hypothetical protein n=1 Tax=Aromatoleum evansii TaxID=59406 RepID=UPI00145F9AD2|nr:hypothetical protein [Aromatoleum evansii]NMG29523.1 hypothetical protein [Aromatoleum evansii]